MPGGWQGSSSTDRRSTLPANWRTTVRPSVLQRDPVCRCDGCPRCDAIARTLGCSRPSTDVDHAGDRDAHDLADLRGMCSECHGHRTARQGSAARWRYPTRRPPERHPGLTGH